MRFSMVNDFISMSGFDAVRGQFSMMIRAAYSVTSFVGSYYILSEIVRAPARFHGGSFFVGFLFFGFSFVIGAS